MNTRAHLPFFAIACITIYQMDLNNSFVCFDIVGAVVAASRSCVVASFLSLLL